MWCESKLRWRLLFNIDARHNYIVIVVRELTCCGCPLKFEPCLCLTSQQVHEECDMGFMLSDISCQLASWQIHVPG